MGETRKLNIGAGDCPLDGYENIDRKTGQEAYPLAYPDETFDEVRASHILEHFGHAEVQAVVNEWVRVLKPGGVLKIAVPDFDYIAQGYLEGRAEPFASYVMGGQQDENDYHRTVFNEERLRDVMHTAGLSGIERWASDAQDCSSLPVSLNLKGTKSVGASELSKPFPKVKIAAVMSMPRLAFADNMFCAHQTLIPLGIPFERVTGAFWGQCLERVIEPHLTDGSEYVLTLDYDTVFDRNILHRLVTLMHENPHVDALAPLQMKRESDEPLCNLVRDDGTPYVGEVALHEFDRPLTRARTAHFGLTLLRVSALKRMPHPWFLAVPDADGKWGEGRRDEDIQFWHKWREVGNSVYVATQVSIGHLQLVASWPTRDLGVHHQYLDDWHKRGVPVEARQ